MKNNTPDWHKEYNNKQQNGISMYIRIRIILYLFKDYSVGCVVSENVIFNLLLYVLLTLQQF